MWRNEREHWLPILYVNIIVLCCKNGKYSDWQNTSSAYLINNIVIQI